MDKKSIILIGAYCPDEERQKLLFDLVMSLQKLRESFDILISSHTKVPDYILDKIDYYFYDQNNELIYDLDYINQPWFSPSEESIIYTTYTTGYSTYLAVYRLLIGGLGLSKVLGYSKVHWVEYDTQINDYVELFDNDKLLDDYGSVVYKKEYRDFENNAPYPSGSFISINVNKLDENFLFYNKEKLLSLIEGNPSKTNEKVTEEILKRNNTQFVKNYDILIEKGINVGLSSQTQKDELTFWTTPFYNSEKDTIEFVCWNNKSEKPINVNVIVNDDKLITYKQVNKFQYFLTEIGKLNDIENILVIINDKIKMKIDFNEIDKHKFIKNNYIKKLK